MALKEKIESIGMVTKPISSKLISVQDKSLLHGCRDSGIKPE